MLRVKSNIYMKKRDMRGCALIAAVKCVNTRDITRCSLVRIHANELVSR